MKCDILLIYEDSSEQVNRNLRISQNLIKLFLPLMTLVWIIINILDLQKQLEKAECPKKISLFCSAFSTFFLIEGSVLAISSSGIPNLVAMSFRVSGFSSCRYILASMNERGTLSCRSQMRVAYLISRNSSYVKGSPYLQGPVFSSVIISELRTSVFSRKVVFFCFKIGKNALESFVVF